MSKMWLEKVSADGNYWFLTNRNGNTCFNSRHKTQSFSLPSAVIAEMQAANNICDILYAESAQIKSPTTSNGEVLCGKLVCYSKRQEKCFNESQHFAYQFGSLNKHPNFIVKINFLNMKWNYLKYFCAGQDFVLIIYDILAVPNSTTCHSILCNCATKFWGKV